MRTLMIAMVAPLAAAPASDAPPSWGQWSHWGDQGDGTYRNPVMPADFSDLDAIRVGDDFYAISSTLHGSPGMAVLRSRDLVNWRVIGHVVPDLTVIGSEFRWDRLARHGRGVWAGSIRYHAGRFHVFFGAPDEGMYVSTATDPAGPWSPLHQLIEGAGWDDCSALWDDDGKAYFIGTKFADGYKTYLFRMAADGRSIDRASATLLHEGLGREASKLIKKDGWYYVVYSEHKDGIGRYVMARRSHTPMGPYGEPRQLEPVNFEDYEPNQGGIVEAAPGKWFFLTHHGRQSWEGRAMSLLPVVWRDGWPMIGDPDPKRAGAMVWHWLKPIASKRPADLGLSDDFTKPVLQPQWEWNHQPRADHWSLTERPGWVRLRAWPQLVAGDLRKTGNFLGQRSYRTTANTVTVKLDLARMTDGQHAGLAHVSGAFAAIGIVQSDTARRVEFRTAAGAADIAPFSQPIIWLRTTWGVDGQARYSYSADGRLFRPAGSAYQMTHGDYRGDRVGVYTYNNRADRGSVDVDRFEYTVSR